MKLTKIEKITFSFLSFFLIFSFMILIVKVSNTRSQNKKILAEVSFIASLTDRTVLNKTFDLNEIESKNKLNLNKANLASIKELPCLNAPLAKRIFTYIKEKGPIKDLNDLINVKGLSKKRIKELGIYATANGGYTGSASWGEKISLNFASIDDLSGLPGVSKATAEKIIEFRNNNGGFHSCDELYAIPGLNEKTILKFIDMVEVK